MSAIHGCCLPNDMCKAMQQAQRTGIVSLPHCRCQRGGRVVLRRWRLSKAAAHKRCSCRGGGARGRAAPRRSRRSRHLLHHMHPARNITAAWVKEGQTGQVLVGSRIIASGEGGGQRERRKPDGAETGQRVRPALPRDGLMVTSVEGPVCCSRGGILILTPKRAESSCTVAPFCTKRAARSGQRRCVKPLRACGTPFHPLPPPTSFPHRANEFSQGAGRHLQSVV